MTSRTRLAPLVAVGILPLAACATVPMLHTQAEINGVATSCGLAPGELFQDEAEKRLLFLMKSAPTLEQRACVARWARKNHLKAVFVQMDFPS